MNTDPHIIAHFEMGLSPSKTHVSWGDGKAPYNVGCVYTSIYTFTYWCLVGNGWEWGNGMIITSDYGSFPHSLLSTSKYIYLRSSSTQHAQRWVLARRFVTQWVFSSVIDPKKASIQFLDLKGLVNRKFETHWVLLSYSYLGAFSVKKASGNVRISAWRPDAFCASQKKHLGFPRFLQKGKFFQGVEKINATWRYSCGSHESDEYLMISHAYRHSNAFVLFQ